MASYHRLALGGWLAAGDWAPGKERALRMGMPGGTMQTGLGEQDLGFAPPLGQFLSLASNAKGQLSLQFRPWVPGGGGGEGSTG